VEREAYIMRIGLLEDNPTLVELMRTALEMTGHSVYSHTWGQSLLETIFEGHGKPTPSLPYDLLIVDLNLPGDVSGKDVITAIRCHISPAVLPIIVVSAGGPHELDSLQRHFPSLPIVRKPFTIQVLLQKISLLVPEGNASVP
jgi:DNA-binding response OmpR family regulator